MDVSQASLIPLSKALFSLIVTGSSLAAGVSGNPRARPRFADSELQHAFNYSHLFILQPQSGFTMTTRVMYY